MAKGMLYTISAPSGAGKSSLMQALLNNRASCNLQISISHTTRPPRPGEVNGKHYFFIDQNEFREMVGKNVFLEHAKVFGNYYGTSRKTIEQGLEKGTNIFLDIDWQGVKQIRKKLPNSRSIFILPPSRDELNRRLLWRAQDTQEVIEKRMGKAVEEMRHYAEYDYLIINDDFEIALNDLQAILRAEYLRMSQQKERYHALISNLLAD